MFQRCTSCGPLGGVRVGPGFGRKAVLRLYGLSAVKGVPKALEFGTFDDEVVDLVTECASFDHYLYVFFRFCLPT